MTDLEKRICEKTNAKYGVFTGNGTTAMYLAFSALELQDRKVIFPGISCTNPVNAALYAGYTVDFCDVRLSDYTIDTYQLEKMLQTGEYGIVVPTHIYGHRYDEKKVRELCTRYGTILFEDAAQSFYIGNMDVSVMSFGHTKVCDTRLGGGIALTNNFELAEKMRERKHGIPILEKPVSELFDKYREAYYKIVKEETDWNRRNQKLKELQLNSKEYFIFDLQDNKEIYSELIHLNETVELRRQKAMLYQKYLNEKYVVKPEVQDFFRWRYTFLYKGNREFLLCKARECGIDISSWYYSLAGIYKGEHLKNADYIEDHVINLWVDGTHSIEQIRKEIQLLNGMMEENTIGNE